MKGRLAVQSLVGFVRLLHFFRSETETESETPGKTSMIPAHPIVCLLRVATFAACSLAVLSDCIAEDRRTIPLGEKPESVCRGFGGRLYATMINGDEPGDGTIVSIDGDAVTVFATGLNSPKGLVFVDGMLVTADETTLWKVDQSGKVTKLADAASFPKPIEFLNDVAASRDRKSVYVAEMSTPSPMFDPSGERKLWALDGTQAEALPAKGCVYRVTLDGEVTQVVPPGDPALRFPNGLAVGGTAEKERLFCADFFTGNIVLFENGTHKIVGQGPRGLDGLAVTQDAFFASSWTEGVVWKIDRKTKEKTVLIDGLKTAADFFFDRKNDQLLIPDMVAGTLTFLPLNTPVAPATDAK
jgi:hypothetical protein